jgi:YVTN family beta-propeller protein
MKEKSKRDSVVLASTIFILFFILILSTASAASIQNSSSTRSYAYITNAGNDTVSVIDTATNQITATVSIPKNIQAWPTGVTVSSDGKKVYVANSKSNTVSEINTSTNNVTANINVGIWPYGIAVTPDGTKVFVANRGYPSSSNIVSVIDATTDTVTANVTVGSSPYGVAVTLDGTKVYVTNSGSNNVSVIDAATATVIANVKVGSYPTGVAATPDGKKIYVVSDDGVLSVIDITTNTVIATLTVGKNLEGLAVSPDGNKVYVTNFYNSIVYVIDTINNKVIASVNVGSIPLGIAVTPDGKNVYVVSEGSNTVSVIDTNTNKVIATVPVGNTATAFGQFIASVPEKSTPTITWSNPSDIVIGTPLSDTQLNATASVPGTFNYTPSAGTLLNAGIWTLNVSFTPTDTTNYTTATASVQINVSEATHVSNSTINNSTNDTNLLLNANFTNGCKLADYWSIYENVSGNVDCVTTPNVQSVCYKGQLGDDGTKRLQIYQAPITGVAAGDKIRFSIQVSGNICSSPTIVGIGACDSSRKWLGESDVYINASYTPQLYQVTYVCPRETNYVVVYLECMDINPNSIIDFSLEKAELVHTP